MSFVKTALALTLSAVLLPLHAAEKTYDTDIVVIGAGAAGTAAAWAAAEKGFKVIELEKQAVFGGTGKYSEGIFAVESRLQRD